MKRAPRWVVTRQRYWPDGTEVVEIAAGGRDYSNPDELCPQYPGEGEDYTDPREAVETAVRILRAWQGHGHKKARLAIGATLGFTLPFNPCTITDAKHWADKRYAALPKCAQCGGLLGDERYGNHDFGEYDCCSESCAEKYHQPEAA